MRKLFISLLCVGVVLFGGNGFALPLDYDGLLDKFGEYKNGEISSDDMIALCTDVLAKEIKDDGDLASLSLYLRSRTYMDKKDVEAALVDADALIAIRPTWSSSYSLRSMIMLETEDYQGAVDALTKAAEYTVDQNNKEKLLEMAEKYRKIAAKNKK